MIGTSNLRVVDASVMPTIPGGQTGTTTAHATHRYLVQVFLRYVPADPCWFVCVRCSDGDDCRACVRADPCHTPGLDPPQRHLSHTDHHTTPRACAGLQGPRVIVLCTGAREDYIEAPDRQRDMREGGDERR